MINAKILHKRKKTKQFYSTKLKIIFIPTFQQFFDVNNYQHDPISKHVSTNVSDFVLPASHRWIEREIIFIIKSMIDIMLLNEFYEHSYHKSIKIYMCNEKNVPQKPSSSKLKIKNMKMRQTASDAWVFDDLLFLLILFWF